MACKSLKNIARRCWLSENWQSDSDSMLRPEDGLDKRHIATDVQKPVTEERSTVSQFPNEHFNPLKKNPRDCPRSFWLANAIAEGPGPQADTSTDPARAVCIVAHGGSAAEPSLPTSAFATQTHDASLPRGKFDVRFDEPGQRVAASRQSRIRCAGSGSEPGTRRAGLGSEWEKDRARATEK